MNGDQQDSGNFASMREPSDVTPGYYWARYKSDGWEPVLVEKLEDELFLLNFIDDKAWPVCDWTFGPRLEPPE